jgi:hypothetical protein
MRRKRRVQRTQPDGTAVHPVGQERFVNIQNYVGDLPSDEPVDWLPQSEEYDPDAFLLGTVDTTPHEHRR